MNRKIKVNLVKPVHSTEVLVRRATREALVCTGQSNIQAALWAQKSMLRASATANPSDAEIPTKIAIMYNEISKGYYNLATEITIEMLEPENNSYGNEWRTFQE